MACSLIIYIIFQNKTNKLEGLLTEKKKFNGQIKSLNKFNFKKNQCYKRENLLEIKLNFLQEETTEKQKI
jgi:hypothetical protein